MSISLPLFLTAVNVRSLNIKLFQISTRVYDLETRGVETKKFAEELKACEELFEAKKYSKGEPRINKLAGEINKYYQDHQGEFATEYVYEGVKFQDIYMDISTGRRVGFIASPLADGVYPGLILLRGAAGSALDLKRALYYYAQKGYTCLSPEFNSESHMDGTFDLSSWHNTFIRHKALDPSRIGVISYSRGSVFAYKLIEHDIPFKAWLTYWGVLLPSHIKVETIKKNPVPVYILHGKKDDQCPVAWAYNLEKIYQSAEVPYQIKIFPDEGHGFSREAMDEIRESVAEFLAIYLKGEKDSPKLPELFMLSSFRRVRSG